MSYLGRVCTREWSVSLEFLYLGSVCISGVSLNLGIALYLGVSVSISGVLYLGSGLYS